MSIKDFLVKALPEFVLVCFAAVCMTIVVAQGFYVSAELQFNVAVIIVLTVLLQLPLFACTFKRTFTVPGIAIFAVIGVVAIIVGFATSTGANALEDAEENNAIFFICAVIVNGLVFGLSRTRISFLFLLALGLLTIGFIQFAYHQGLIVESLGFFFGVVLLFVYQEYCESVSKSEASGRASFGTALLTSVAAMAIPAAIAALVFGLVIAPLAPDHVILKLFTDYRTLETVEVNNPYHLEEVEDPDLKSQTLSDEVIYGNIPIDTESNGITLGDASAFIDSSIESMGSAASYDLEEDEGNVEDVTYELPVFFWVFGILAVILAIVLVIMLRKLLRERWANKVKTLSATEQVEKLYTRMLKGLDKLGLGRGETETTQEFAENSSSRMLAFSMNTQGADWTGVSNAYEQAHYGLIPPSNEDLSTCWNFYNGFCKNAATLTGRLKYCFKYFWIL